MRVIVAVALLLTPATAAAHDGAATGPPSAATALVLAVLVYAHGVRRLQARGRAVGAGRQVAAAVAALTLAGALLPPLDRVAAALLSAHMGQHVLLTLVAAPLLALAQPLNVALAALPRAWRPRRLPGARLPVAAAALAHAVALWAWHLPPLYDLALASPDAQVNYRPVPFHRRAELGCQRPRAGERR